MLLEREDIQQWRDEYLHNIRCYHSQGKKIYYTDGTWVNMGHANEGVWQDSIIKLKKQAFLSGLSTGLRAPTGKGGLLIVLHAGCDEGFVDGALEIFKAKENGDYHDEMNGTYYEEWFAKKFLPDIVPGSVIVMDNTPYHSVHDEKIPMNSMKKEYISGMANE